MFLRGDFFSKKAGMKTHQSLALSFFIAIGLAVGGCGEHFEVTSAQQLIKALNISEANNFDANIVLLDDLDFSDSALTLPFGVSSDLSSCESYTGVFEGNGHTIKGLVMNNKDNQEYNCAGLFCSLENATFENLVIDSSCSFAGNNAGPLCVSLRGSLTATNITNKAAVSGGNGVGGFVGRVEGLSQKVEVTFKDCMNDGKITGQSLVGGFVGKIKDNEDLTMTISNCTNNGIVTGSVGSIGGFIGQSKYNEVISIVISDSTNHGNACGNSEHVGGFVGCIWGDTNMTMTIINCANDGFITGPSSIGGFTGSIYQNDRIEVNISNCVNNGNVTGNVTGDDADIGGFAGSILGNVNATVTLSNFINDGNITGGFSVGGLVGMTYPSNKDYSLFFTVINSANNGDVSAETGNGCGLFCASSFAEHNVNTTVLNSINKGRVFAKAKSYGITDRTTKARNVVSMGKVTGSMDSYTFWPGDFSDADSLFGLSGCPKCFVKITFFELNTNTGFFEVVDGGEYVDALLNYEARNQDFGMMWTSELELVDKLMLDVSVSGLFTTSFLVESGTKLGDVGGLSKYLNGDEYGVVGEKSQTRVVCKETDIVSRNMSLIVGKWVNVSICAPFKDSKQMVTGETLYQVSQLFGFALDDFVVVDTNTSETLNESWVLKSNVSLRLCHSVNVSGVNPFYKVVEHGTMLSQIEKLSGFFNESFIVFNASNPDIVFGSETFVETNMDINVSKVSRQDIIVVIDDDVTNVSVDDIKDAITDVIVVPDGEHVWVDVVSEGDGSFRISVIQTDGVTDSVSDSLKECLNHES